MVKAPVSPVATAVPLLHALGSHRAAQVRPAPGPELHAFHAHAAMELPATRHVEVAARVVHNGAAVLVVGSAWLVYVRACYRLGRAFEPPMSAREHTVHLLTRVPRHDPLLQ